MSTEKSLSEIASLSNSEYKACIELFAKTDQIFEKVAKWKEATRESKNKTIPNTSLILARIQVVYSWHHFVRGVYYGHEKKNIEEQKRQLDESCKHLKRAMIIALECALDGLSQEFDYIEKSYKVSIQKIIPDYIKYKKARATAKNLLKKNNITIQNRDISYHDKISYRECDDYEKLVDILGDGVLSLISANEDLKKQEWIRRGQKIGIMAAVVTAIATAIGAASYYIAPGNNSSSHASSSFEQDP